MVIKKKCMEHTVGFKMSNINSRNQDIKSNIEVIQMKIFKGEGIYNS
jgi:Ni2+-binding GTPase involved in maturation of urease and hydrogenase